LKNKVSLYLHWPWCNSNCSYCDYYKLKHQYDIDYSKTLSAFNKDILYFKKIYKEVSLEAIHIGGGSPSSMPLKVLKKIILDIKKEFFFMDNIEISIEINPEDVRNGILNNLKRLGINRLALGVQSFSNYNLKTLNRRHDKKIAFTSIKQSLDYFKNVSIDLMYDIPNSTAQDWYRDLEYTMHFPVKHISINEFSHPKKQNSSIQFKTKRFLVKTANVLKEKGFILYESSNFAKEGFIPKYNLAIFDMKNIIGIGPSSHSRLIKNDKIFLINNPRTYGEWLKKTKRVLKQLNKKEILEEFLIQGLKTSKGVNLNFLAFKYKLPVDKLISFKNIEILKKKGILKIKNDKYLLSLSARNIQNSVITNIMTQ